MHTKNNVIGLTDISPGNVLRISISGSAINNTSGRLAVKLVESGSSKILKTFNIRRLPVERRMLQCTFNATILVQPVSTSKKFVCEYSAPSREQGYFEFNVTFMLELIKIV